MRINFSKTMMILITVAKFTQPHFHKLLSFLMTAPFDIFLLLSFFAIIVFFFTLMKNIALISFSFFIWREIFHSFRFLLESKIVHLFHLCSFFHPFFPRKWFTFSFFFGWKIFHSLFPLFLIIFCFYVYSFLFIEWKVVQSSAFLLFFLHKDNLWYSLFICLIVVFLSVHFLWVILTSSFCLSSNNMKQNTILSRFFFFFEFSQIGLI